jgi:GAF domain-containing protein
MSEKAWNYYRTLYEVVKAVNSSLDPETVLKKVAERISWALEVKACSIRLVSPDGKYLAASASHGLSTDYLRKGRIEVDKSGIDQEALRGKAVQIKDAGADPRFQYPDAAQREGIASVAVVPLRVEDGTSLGVLRVYSGQSREFSEEEIEFLEAMADLCALAIQNAKRHESLRSDFDLLTAFEYRLFED